ncbi:sulfatase [Thalassotalea crassostreae]|uniref:sulfatase family protein n=1 Tax=Thalassotalea crassostreae TaxID=1763536 RepID=UPI0008386D2A|nr:sulfatase [Thalassotalea crassostreae]
MKRLVSKLLFPLFGLILISVHALATATIEPKSPNIIVIMSDDHATNAISAYQGRLNRVFQTPNIDRLAKSGVRLDGLYASNSICTPSRATILTGQYSHTNGVKTLGGKIAKETPTLPHELQSLGYQTAIIGKWHIKTEPFGFDYYNVLPGQGDYYNPKFKEKGNLWVDAKGGGKTIKGYVTDITTDLSLAWLNKRDKSKPFMLMINNKAPHGPWEPAKRHQHQFLDVEIPEPKSLLERGNHGPGNEVVVNGIEGFQFGSSISRRWTQRSFAKRFLQKGVKKKVTPSNEAELIDETKRAYQMYLKNYLSTVTAVDENVGRVLDYVEENGLQENTIIVYTSDQGMMLGEHDYGDKRWIYEESSRMPFIVSYPGVIEQDKSIDKLYTNADIAPTLLSFAGKDTPTYMQGKSFAASLKSTSTAEGHDAIYYRYWLHMAHHYNPAHYGIRTPEYKLVFFYGLPAKEGSKKTKPTPPYWEMYDMKNDVLEMNNIYHDEKYKAVRERLKVQLLALKEELGDTDENNAELMAIRKKHW